MLAGTIVKKTLRVGIPGCFVIFPSLVFNQTLKKLKNDLWEAQEKSDMSSYNGHAWNPPW